MQALIQVICEGCYHILTIRRYDTADDPQDTINDIYQEIINHRPECSYYGDNTPAQNTDQIKLPF